MREIHLAGGKLCALVDAEDYDRMKHGRWWAHRPQGSLTVYARTKSDGRWLLMHRAIMAPVLPDMVVDHIDRNGLNNQKSNLRVITQSENAKYLAADLGHQNIHAVTTKGRTYFYWQPRRSTGAAGRRIRLPNDPQSSEFRERLMNLNASEL